MNIETVVYSLSIALLLILAAFSVFRMVSIAKPIRFIIAGGFLFLSSIYISFMFTGEQYFYIARGYDLITVIITAFVIFIKLVNPLVSEPLITQNKRLLNTIDVLRNSLNEDSNEINAKIDGLIIDMNNKIERLEKRIDLIEKPYNN